MLDEDGPQHASVESVQFALLLPSECGSLHDDFQGGHR